MINFRNAVKLRNSCTKLKCIPDVKYIVWFGHFQTVESLLLPFFALSIRKRPDIDNIFSVRPKSKSPLLQ